jgi:DNA (cytosine-5)-methyltransferase 1
MNHLDLFSGIGGFALAAKWCGIETIQFVEIDKFCQKILTKNFPNIPIHDDIKTFYFNKKIDLLTGGFPCQGFSIAGKKRGKYDNRYLWPEMYRIIKECKPNWIIAENVPGIIEMELDNIIDDLAREGYESQAFIIPACAANAPHRRDRLWIIANRSIMRCHRGIYYWQTRSIQKNKEWDMETLQSEWEKLKPISWKTLSARDWFTINHHVSRIDNGLPNRLDKLRSVGNAIVPQVIYPIMKLISFFENNYQSST